MSGATAQARHDAGAWRDVGGLAEFPDGEGRGLLVDGLPVAVFRLADEVFALFDQCPHGAVKLSNGWVENGCVECPFHQALFDLRTGAVLAPPAEEGVRIFPIRIANERVELLI
jgi:nitrite reductase/ring-hydroxylating ferredoxin subunit